MRYIFLFMVFPALANGQKAIYPVPQFQTVAAADEQLGSTMTLDDLKSKQKEAEQEKAPTTINVQPAAEPSPALKYRFYPAKWDLNPGSALLHFSRAQLMLAQRSEEQRNRWQSGEWMDGEGEGQIPTVSELEADISSLEPIFQELHQLAMSEDFKADHRVRDLRGPDVYMYLLPDIQESRALARILAMKIRFQLLQQDFVGAISSVSDGLRLAEFIGQGETLIQKLVGIAVQSVMRDRITDMIATHGCPNLYWALVTIPRPMVNISESVNWELNNIARVLPVLAEAESAEWTDAQAALKWSSVMKDLRALSSGSFGNDDASLALAIGSVTFAEEARKRLEAAGFPRAKLQKLPAMQLVLIDARRELNRVGDDLGKAHLLPAHLGAAIVKQQDDRFQQWLQKNRMASMAAVIGGLLYPAVVQAKAAETRTQMAYNRLMTLEALRMHAEAHAGKVPDSLEQLSPVPAMSDPYIGQPFEYKVETIDGAKVVTLTADGPKNYQPLRVLRIRINK